MPRRRGPRKRLHDATLQRIEAATTADELDEIIEDHGADIAKLIRRDQADADTQDRLDRELQSATELKRELLKPSAD